MLQDVAVPINFDGGLDTKTDEKLVLPGRLLVLENAIRKTSRKIRKRNGYEALSTSILGGSTIASAVGAAIAESELAIFSLNRLYSYSPGAAGWIDKGSVFSVNATAKTVIRNGYQQTTPDIAINDSIAVHAWADTRGGIRATVIDQESGAPILSDVSINATGKNPRCLAISGYIFVIFADSNTLKFRRLNIANPTEFEAAVNIGTDLNATGYHDATLSGTKMVLAYSTNTSQVKLVYLTADGVVGSTTIGLPNAVSYAEAASNCVAICVEPSSLDICVAWHNSANGLRAVIARADFTTKVAISTIDASVAPAALRVTSVFASSSQVAFYYEMTATNDYDHFLKSNTLTTAGVVGTAAVLKRSVGLASKVFKVGTEFFLNAVHASALQATYFTLKTDGTLMAKLQASIAGGLPADRVVPQVVVSDSIAYFPVTVKTRIVSGANTTFTLTGISEERLDFTNERSYVTGYMANSLHIAGGFVSIYDGVSPVELGFHLFPEYVTATPAGAGGSMASGVYQYFVVYEWVDNHGQLHRSAPSIGKSVTVTGPTGKVTLQISTLRLTAKTGTRSNVVLAVYRTEANGTTAYKVTSTASPTFNDPTVDTVSFEDTLADASITSSEILYTTGGVMENIAPPACAAIAVSKNRMLAIGLEDGLEWWPSRKHVQGEAVNFSDALASRVEPVGGRLYCGAFMDDKIILFKESAIYYVAGDGPDELGVGSFTDPVAIPSDVGCKAPHSIVLTPEGLMFKSNKGIYLLNRALQVVYIGADVEAYNAQSVTSAVLVDDKNQVRFTTDDGVALIYDYYEKQWSTFTNHEGVAGGIWNRTYVYVRNSGEVYRETEDAFLDDGLHFKVRVGTAWIKVAGVQGYQRVKRAAILGEYRSDHVLRVSVGYDYAPIFPHNYYFRAGEVLDQSLYGEGDYGDEEVYGGVEDNVYQCEAHLKRQKCQAIRFLFEDVTSGDGGESFSLSDLTLLVGVKKGLNKLRSTKRLG